MDELTFTTAWAKFPGMADVSGSASDPDAPSSMRWSESRFVRNYCLLFLLLFAAISFFAIRNKSATYDEPLHLVGGVIHRHHGDFRINPEDPALFGWWASLPHSRDSIQLDLADPNWTKMLEAFGPHQWPFVVKTLYQTPGNDADALLLRSRLMFLAIGVLLGAMIIGCAWRLGGPGAGMIAGAMYCFDPNFLAHAPLVKNDVMLAGLMLAVAVAVWRFGQRGTIGWLVVMSIATGLAVNVKYSGVLLGPMIAIVLVIRAAMKEPWIVLGRRLVDVRHRLLAVLIVCIVVGLTSYTMIWACYGFRFAPTPDSPALHDTAPLVEMIRFNRQATGQPPENGPVVDALLWMQSKRLLPQAWVHGFLYTYATTIARTSYLLGERSNSGWWYYFPFAMLVKTPMATLIAMVIAWVGNLRQIPVWNRWTLIALIVPPLLYFLGSLNSGMNIGLRHILPVYPFIFIGTAVGLAEVWRRNRRVMSGVCLGLMAGLMVEIAAAFPNYIPFFNAVAGGSRGGLHLLADSNLDWGQDLRPLADWRARNTSKPLYLAYFGSADPGSYNLIDTVLMPGGTPASQGMGLAGNEPCYIAVSATVLQGVYLNDPVLIQFYDALRRREPLTVIGGSIYIYEF